MEKEVRVDISARHVHLTRESADALFGKNYTFTEKKKIAVGALANERLKLVGPKGSISNVGILLPLRNETQVEISMTDTYALGISAPIRLSGDVKNSAGITIVGPEGTLELVEGVIVAKRHMHIGPNLAEKYGVTNNDVVKIYIASEERTVTYDEVCVRICAPGKNEDIPSVHIDTDEGNAAGIRGSIQGKMIFED